MIVRPPSLVRDYDDFYSGDPAIVQLAEDASDEDKKDHERKLEVARETGNWSGVVVEGAQPTKFTMKPLAGDVYRRMMDMYGSRAIGIGELASLAFRCACVGVTNLGDVDTKRTKDDRLGQMAPVKLTNDLDAIDLGIVSELGGHVLRRARDVSPKS